MRYVRNTIYPPDKEPSTIIVPEDSLTMSAWQAANRMREEAVRAGLEEMVDIEVFEYEGDFISATIEGKRRADRRLDVKTRNSHILYDFLIATFQNPLLADKATISTSRPSPLDKAEILEVLMKAVEHPSYRGFVISIHDRNMEPVRLCVTKDGS